MKNCSMRNLQYIQASVICFQNVDPNFTCVTIFDAKELGYIFIKDSID